jgi:hypothetical protein
MCKMLVIPADPAKPLAVREVSIQRGLEEIYDATHCEMIELCYPSNHLLGQCGAYVDENGLFSDKPRNTRLEILFRNNNSGQGLVGDAVVFGIKPRCAEEQDVPRAVLTDCGKRGWKVTESDGQIH